MLIGLLRTFARPHRAALLGVVALQVAQTAGMLYLPRLSADIIDNGVATGDTAYIWRVGAVMVLVSLGQLTCAVAAVYYGSRVAMAIGRDVRATLFHRVTRYSAQDVAVLGAPTLITRITNDVQQVQMLVLVSCTLLVAAPIMVVGGVVMAVREDAGLSWLLAVCVPLLLLAVGLAVVRMVPQFRRMQQRLDGMNRVLREQIAGIRVVRAFVRERHEVRRFAVVNDELTDTSLRAGRLMALPGASVTLILNCSTAVLIWLGADRVAAGSLSIGALVAFLSYLTQILIAVMMGTMMAMMAPRAAVSADRIQEVLDIESSVVDVAAPRPTDAGRGDVELRDVSFRYPGADESVLSEISLRSGAGMTTAIIGSTGAGKTTLLNLIPRLFDATGGAVVVDGVDVRDIAAEDLRRRIGLVPQRPYLFSGTVASNLRYGKEDATDEELWEALQIAQAAGFVSAMPGGLEAAIQQGGTNVSGGQRQRLAIARALVRKPEVYLFDDSFSALDLATDARLRAALAPHIADATVIVVAQRVSTIATADQILVLEDGRTVGLGTHDELVATCPTYREIVDSQFTSTGAA